MSDTDIPGMPDDQPSADGAPNLPEVGETASVEPTRPYDELSPYAPPGADFPVPVSVTDEPTSPVGGAAPPPPYPTPYGTPMSNAPLVPGVPLHPYQGPQSPPQPPGGGAVSSTRVPGWIWPVVCAVSLVVGILGGAIGGALVADNTNQSGGILKIESQGAVPLPADNRSIPSVAAKLLPSTVKIVAEYGGQARGAAGSGWVFDKQGHVITNNHVVAQAASDNGPIDVIDEYGNHHKATVVGRSSVYDLAVLKVDGISKLPPVAIGAAKQLRIGDTVVAVGSPLALSASVTSGIISAVDRPVTTGTGAGAAFINAIQTDAAINPGNSGGPLANLRGQVIGVNSALATLGTSSGQEGTNIGIGFAIPIEQVLVTVDQILRTGKAQYPVIGVKVRGSAKVDGAEVISIDPGTPAARSQLRVGDVITHVDSRPVTDQTDVVVAIRAHLVTDTVVLTVLRGSQVLKISVGLVAKTG